MPQPLTPQPASSSFVVAESIDTPQNRFDQLGPTYTTATVSLGVLSASNAIVASTILAKTTYSTQNIVTTTYNSGLSSQFIISRVVFSTPIVMKSFSQSFGIVPSNTTVWNTYGSPSSLLLTAGQNDQVAWTVAVVSDSTI